MERSAENEFHPENKTREEKLFESLGNILKNYARGKVTRDALLDNNFDLIKAISEIEQTAIIPDTDLEMFQGDNPRLNAISFSKKYQIEDRLEEAKKSLRL